MVYGKNMVTGAILQTRMMITAGCCQNEDEYLIIRFFKN